MIVGTLIDKAISIGTNLTNGTIGSLDGSTVTNNGSYITTNTGYAGLTAGPHQTHLLPDWDMEATFSDVGTGNTSVQMGIFDKQVSGLRHVFVIVNTDHTISLKIGSIVCFTASLPANFSFASFGLRIRYRDCQISFTTIETGRILHFKYCYNLINHYSNPVGNFCVGNSVGVVKINSFGVSSQQPINMAWLVIGDSISAGRKLLPPTCRWPDRLQEYFYYFSHQTTRKVYTCASPSAKTQHMLDLINSIRALAPYGVMVLVGDNDPSNDVASYATKLISLVNQLQAAGAFVVVLAMTADRDDPHIDFSTYILNTLSSQVTDPGALLTIDTLSPMSLNNDPAQGADMQYLTAGDGVHPNLQGSQLIASTVFAQL